MRLPRLRADRRIALVYAIFGALWVRFSDQLVSVLVTDPAMINTLQTYKGWAFVAVSALVIYFLLERELTSRNIAEAKLGESEERYRQLFANSMDAILLTEPDGTIHSANPAACLMFGHTEEEIRAIGREGLVDRSDVRLNPALEERARTGKFHGELTFLRSDGTKFEGEISTNLFKGQDGNDRTSMIIRDITARKKAEEALRRNEEFLSVIYNNTDVGIFIVTVEESGEFRYEGINPMHEKLMGLANAQVTGKTPHELVEYPSVTSMQSVEALYQDCVQSRRPIESELFVREGPAQGWWLSRITPVIDAQKDKVTRLIGTSMLITERKRAEQELLLSRNRLAELSRRLVGVHEAERRAIGRELHDQIGQILTATKITLDLATQIPAEAAAKKIEQAQELTDELLQRVSRISLELRPPMLDDLGLVPALVWHVNKYAGQTGIQVNFKHSGMEGKRFDPEIETTAYRVVQESLTNVARHAKATRVGFNLHVEDGQMQIQIEDNGQGFDVEAALAENRGLGGMRERAQLIGGKFHITSEKGKGTRQLIQLPLHENSS